MDELYACYERDDTSAQMRVHEGQRRRVGRQQRVGFGGERTSWREASSIRAADSGVLERRAAEER